MDLNRDIFKSGIPVPEMYKLVSSERIEDTEVKTGVLLYMYSPESILKCKHCLKLTIACMHGSGVSSVHDAGDAILAEWLEEDTPLSDTIFQVVRCAFRLRDMCNVQRKNNHSLHCIQIAISAGRFSIVDLEEHKCFVAIGPAVEEIRSVMALLESGTIILSPEAWQLCDQEELLVTNTENEEAVKVHNISQLHKVTAEDICLYNMTIPLIGDPSRMYLVTNVEKEKIIRKFKEMETKEASPEPQRGFHGVLTYRRESDRRKNILLPLNISDHNVWCEFCGAKAKPPLDFSKSPNPEEFCCAKYMELFRKMKQHCHSLKEQASGPSQDYDFYKEKTHQQRARAKARVQNISPEVAAKHIQKGKSGASEKCDGMAGCTVTSCGKYTTITFRLSDYVKWKRSNRPDDDVCSSSVPAGFGLCRHQGPMQKFYSDGKKFLTILPDGIVQLYYPSGNLAITTFIDGTQKVCIVLDDIITNCPVRAFFTSTGDAFCYHSNRSTWLHLDEWGGHKLNEDGSRRSKWTWTAQTDNPTPFNTICLSLNNNISVRVQGRESVFVKFLGSGQQARFSVGSSVKAREPAPSLCKDELMLQVTQLKARLTLERLRQCLESHSATRGRSFKLPLPLVSQEKKLLNMTMEEKDKDYIQHYLEDCQ